MTIKKVGRTWEVNGKPIDSYELYAVFASSAIFIEKHGKVSPKQFTPELVKEFCYAKKNQLPPFQPKKIIKWKDLQKHLDVQGIK